MPKTSASSSLTIFDFIMVHLHRRVWYCCFLALWNTSGLEIEALSPRIPIGKKSAFGASSRPFLRLSSKNDADGVVNESDDSDVEEANDFIGKASKIAQMNNRTASQENRSIATNYNIQSGSDLHRDASPRNLKFILPSSNNSQPALDNINLHQLPRDYLHHEI